MSFEATAVQLTAEVLEKLLESGISNKFKEFLLLSKRLDLTFEQKTESIKSWFHAQRLVLVLGAGCSVPYGLPDWNTLLQKLLLITIKSAMRTKMLIKKKIRPAY